MGISKTSFTALDLTTFKNLSNLSYASPWVKVGVFNILILASWLLILLLYNIAIFHNISKN
jgi:hypothetical protein